MHISCKPYRFAERSSRSLSFSITLAFTGALAACPAGEPGTGPECNDAENITCPAGKVCIDFVCQPVCSTSADCGASEACIDATCAPYAQDCVEHTDCLADWYCANHACAKKLPIGNPCGTMAVACASGWCVDGVCCTSVCDGLCQTCVVGTDAGDGDDGVCGNVPAGGDPDDLDCPGPTACDGAGGCYARVQGDPCADNWECTTGACADGVCCNGACDGTCETCETGTCEAIPNGQDPDEECDGGIACDGNRACWATARGLPCEHSWECSVACADGVCCDSTCSDPCMSCNLIGTLGTCLNVESAEDPGSCDSSHMSGACTLPPCSCGPSGVCGSSGAVACLSGPACSSGVCFEGICCETACAGLCMSCNGAYSQGASGECAAMKYGLDPRDQCAGVLACTGGGTCMTPWVGSRQFGTGVDDEANAVAVDSRGNVVIAGYVSEALEGFTYAGNSDMFVTKYDASGAHRWTRQMGTTGPDIAWGVATDAAGNVYVAGETQGAFDGHPWGGGVYLFLIKFDPDGVRRWSRVLDAGPAYGIAADADGNTFLVGATTKPVDGTPVSGTKDYFAAKFDSLGSLQWIRKYGSSLADEAWGVAVSSSGEVYVAGSTSGNLGGNTSAGLMDAFVAKLDSGGGPVWTRQLGTTADESAKAVALDGGGSPFITGFTKGAFEGATLAGNSDVFLAKYDAIGTKQWTRQIGTTLSDSCRAVTVDTDGGAYLGGSMKGPFDGQTGAGLADVLVVKYNADGVKQWTRLIGGAGEEGGAGAAVDADGNVFVAGVSQGSFDGGTNAGFKDVILVKVSSSGVKQ